MKYIIIERELGDGIKQTIPILFSNSMIHKDMAEAVMSSIRIRSTRLENLKVVSAGFVTSKIISTNGTSESLNIDSREEDAMLIQMNDYMSIS